MHAGKPNQLEKHHSQATQCQNMQVSGSKKIVDGIVHSEILSMVQAILIFHRNTG